MANFTPAGTGGVSSSISLPGAIRKNPTVTEVAVGLVETAVTIPINTAAFQLHCRNMRPLYIGTASAGDVFTLWPGCIWSETNINQPAGFQLYYTLQ